MTPEARAELVRVGLLELQAVRGQLSKVTTDDVARLLAFVDEDPAGQDLETKVTAVCDLLWEYGAYLNDSTPLARAIVARLSGPFATGGSMPPGPPGLIVGESGPEERLEDADKERLAGLDAALDALLAERDAVAPRTRGLDPLRVMGAIAHTTSRDHPDRDDCIVCVGARPVLAALSRRAEAERP